MNPDKQICKTALSEQFKHFFEKCSDLELLERAIRDTAKKQLQVTAESQNRWKEVGGAMESGASHHNMTYRSLTDGNHVFYDSRSRTYEQIGQDIHFHQNKHFQWVLAETYELFEDFIEISYAYAQHLNPPFWKTAEIDRLTPTSDGSYSLDELLRHAADPRMTVDTFAKLRRFRSKYPELHAAESRSPLHQKPVFALALIEILRHVIVHNGGKVRGREAFTQRVLAKAGLLNNGNPSEDLLADIGEFLRDWQGSTVVVLLDAPMSGLPGGYVSRLGYLTNFLLAYAAFVHMNLLAPLLE